MHLFKVVIQGQANEHIIYNILNLTLYFILTAKEWIDKYKIDTKFNRHKKYNWYVLFVFSHPGYFGKVGMRTYRVLKNRSWSPAINLDKLWSLVTEQHRLTYKDKTDKAPVIDVVRAVSGFHMRTSLLWCI